MARKVHHTQANRGAQQSPEAPQAAAPPVDQEKLTKCCADLKACGGEEAERLAGELEQKAREASAPRAAGAEAGGGWADLLPLLLQVIDFLLKRRQQPAE